MSRTIRKPYVRPVNQFTQEDLDSCESTEKRLKNLARYRASLTADHGSFQSKFLKNLTQRKIRRINSDMIKKQEDPLLVTKGFQVYDYFWNWF